MLLGVFTVAKDRAPAARFAEPSSFGEQRARLLAWDTEWWGRVTATVAVERLDCDSAAELDSWSQEHRVELMYLLCRGFDPCTAHVAEDSGFRLMDIRLAYRREDGVADDGPALNAAVRVREVLESDKSALSGIARSSYQLSRFYADPNLDHERCDLLYERWLEVEWSGAASFVLAAEYLGLPAGYITGHVHPGRQTGSIVLIGVSDSARGKGVGAALLSHALSLFRERGARHIEVVTQGRNVSAQRLYSRCGFLLDNVGLWFHKSFTPAS